MNPYLPIDQQNIDDEPYEEDLEDVKELLTVEEIEKEVN